jgi:50S ribosomal protein L16 3-hydroxylase
MRLNKRKKYESESMSVTTMNLPKPLTHLGDMPIEIFLRDYWQKKPLLIRQAFPHFESPLTPDELAGLALEEEVESRLVLEKGTTPQKKPWELRHGPFDEKTFTQLPETHWTLLVQAVDQWVPEVNILLDYFRFIPNWRVDDIMISYAPEHGSVGPHFDYYDVFLLQGLGKRHWQLGQMCDNNSPRIEDIRLKILSEFHVTDDWVLEPGDMLYIPPGIAHWGRAQGADCMTYSIGFRAPSHADILAEIGQEIASDLSDDLRYSDPHLQQQTNPGEITAEAIAQLQEILKQHLTADNIAQWFGKYMTERKYPEQLEEPLDINAEDWIAALTDGEMLWRHPAARLAFHTTNDGSALLFADGEALCCSRALAELICKEVEITWRELKNLVQNPLDRAAVTHLVNQETLLIDE